jgi:hypothetical protein
MNIPKLIAGLRSDLELVEASIHDFETLAKARQPTEALTTVEVVPAMSGHPCKLCGKNGGGIGIPKKRFRPSGVPSSVTKKVSKQARAVVAGR